MPGAIFTIILITIMLIYTGYRVNVLAQKTEYHVEREEYEFHYSKGNQFGQDDGFAVAASITSFGSQAEVVEDERYGTIEFYLKHWDGADIFDWRKLKSRRCTKGDFLVTNDYGLNPLHDKMKKFQPLQEKMKCIDEPYQIWGDYNSDQGQNLMVVFERCEQEKEEERDCESEEDIDLWLQFKYIAIQQNERNYHQNIDDSDVRVSQESFMTFHPVSVSTRADFPRMISVSEVLSHEIPYGITID